MRLSDQEMTIIRQILASVIPDYEVRAFGSRVHGRGLKPFSDIDLVVVGAVPLPSRLLCELQEQFSESDLPYRVDIVDYATASQHFRDIIEQDYETISTSR